MWESFSLLVKDKFIHQESQQYRKWSHSPYLCVFSQEQHATPHTFLSCPHLGDQLSAQHPVAFFISVIRTIAFFKWWVFWAAQVIFQIYFFTAFVRTWVIFSCFFFVPPAFYFLLLLPTAKKYRICFFTFILKLSALHK